MTAETDNTSRSSAQPHPLAGRTVEEFASVGILACPPDATLGEVAWLMANNRVHAVVVSDDSGPEPPVIADVDLIAAADSGHFGQLCARDIAGTEAVSVSGGEPLERAAQLLAEHHASHLLVRDQRRRPVGILSSLDLARAISGRG